MLKYGQHLENPGEIYTSLKKVMIRTGVFLITGKNKETKKFTK
jgi:hypothetical protein